jgi:N-acetylglucosamine-6-phosphate deacetylase
MKAITGGQVFYKGSIEEDLVVLYDDKIKDIISVNDFDKSSVDEIITLDGDYLLPGFIDVHIHGYEGSDVMDGTASSLEIISKGILKNGVTSFLPTTMTMSKDKIEKALLNINDFMIKEDTGGARVLGAHMEGPFINASKKGAQSAKDIITVDEELFLKHKDTIKIISIAPETEGALEAIEKYSNEFIFSIGHTASDYDTAKKAIDNGAKGVTHLFNAMTSLNHRDPGVVGAALTCDCYTELICDYYHVNKAVYQVVLDSKGYNKILLITDCIRAGGLKDGVYDLGGQEVNVEGIKCTLKDGTIAGSMLNYNTAIKNFYNATNSTLDGVFNMSSKNEAVYLGVDDKVGEISKGKFADFAIIDKNFEVEYTIVGGKVLYKRTV